MPGEIRIRAERRAGELLREMKARGERQKRGDNPLGVNSRETRLLNPTPTLSDLGITRDQSSKWQQLAAVPAEEFERAVASPGPVPTTEGIINAQMLRENPQEQRMDRDALWFWGRLVRFAKQAQNYEAERKAGEVRIRAERRAGELLREMRQRGERTSGHAPLKKVESKGATPPVTTLKDLGIRRDQSSK
jgi:hypothetical protein